MPQDTFIKLPEEKKLKIINAAKDEFSRVAIEEVSIKKIAENAGIARGSFYQYFEDKQDLLYYILEIHAESIKRVIKECLKNTKGDLFDFYINLYDYMNEKIDQTEDIKFYRKIFENIKVSGDYFVSEKILQDKEEILELYYKSINFDNLTIKGKEELKMVSKIILIITRKAMVERFKFDSKEDARNDYLHQLEYFKYGIINNKEELC